MTGSTEFPMCCFVDIFAIGRNRTGMDLAAHVETKVFQKKASVLVRFMKPGEMERSWRKNLEVHFNVSGKNEETFCVYETSPAAFFNGSQKTQEAYLEQDFRMPIIESIDKEVVKQGKEFSDNERKILNLVTMKLKERFPSFKEEKTWEISS